MTRVPWCLGAGWGAVALLRLAAHAADPGDAGEAMPRRRPTPGASGGALPRRLTDAIRSRALLALRVLQDSDADRSDAVVHRSASSTAPRRRRPSAAHVRARRPRRRPALRCAATPSRDGRSDDELGRLVRAGELDPAAARRLRRRPTARRHAPRHALLVAATRRRPAPARRRQPPVRRGAARAAAVGRPARPRARHAPAAGLEPDTGARSALPRRPAARRRGDRRSAACTVTDAVRTALDLARSLPFEAAVVAAGRRAARAAASPRARLEQRLFDIAGTRGQPAAPRVRPLRRRAQRERRRESRSRVVLHRWELPPSALQFEVTTARRALRRPHRLRVGGAAARRRVRRADQVRPPAPARTGRRATPSSRRSAARTRSGTRAGRSSAGPGRDLRRPAPLGARHASGRGARRRADRIAGVLPALRVLQHPECSNNTRNAARARVRAGGPPASR